MSSASFHKIAVVMGGWSPEREVSLSSGTKCATALREEGYDVTEIDAGPDLGERLATVRPDAVFNALHGVGGEDGCVQGLFEVMRLPYTHSGVLASALAMDKEKAKAVFRMSGLPVAESVTATIQEAASAHMMEPPYVVKPINQGSSVGVFIVHKGDNRPPAELKDAQSQWSLKEVVMVERYIAGRELTCAVLGDEALGVTEILANKAFYDYEAKYAAGGSDHIVPAPIDADLYEEIRRQALMAHRALGCRGATRSDFRYDPDTNELILLEINTQPGMTPTSLVPELAEHAGMNYRELVRWMVEDASCDR